MHVSNNEEMAFNYMEVIFTCPRGGPTKIPLAKGTAREFEAVWYQNQVKYLYQFCARPFEELEEEDGEIGV